MFAIKLLIVAMSGRVPRGASSMRNAWSVTIPGSSCQTRPTLVAKSPPPRTRTNASPTCEATSAVRANECRRLIVPVSASAGRRDRLSGNRADQIVTKTTEHDAASAQNPTDAERRSPGS